jgi:hypothetical protein
VSARCGPSPRRTTRAGAQLLDVHTGGTTLVSQEYLPGSHPPWLTDFRDPRLHHRHAAGISQVIRIRAGEFVVNI